MKNNKRKKYVLYDAFPGMAEAKSAANDLRSYGDLVIIKKSNVRGERLKYQLWVHSKY